MVMLSTDQSQRFLAAPLLVEADDESRRAVYRALVEDPAPAGTTLVEQGKPNDRLYFVVEGSVAIERTRADGRTDILATLSGPGVFGTTTFFRPSAPSMTIRATTDLALWTLDHPSHERLRRDDPRAAEALSMAVVRTLSDRFDMLDRRLAELMAEHDDDHPRATEWARFRARLFEEPAI